MNQINMKLSNMKFSSFEKAVENSISITSSQNAQIVAHLIPVGEWILNRTKLLMSIAEWRNKYMRFYLTQFDADLENATSYIQTKIHSNSPAIFFMIADENYKILGHIGFSEITSTGAELDNILLGEASSVRNLMQDVEIQSINWIRDFLGLKKIQLKVLSYNFLAIGLHEMCGFQIEERLPIRKVHYLNQTRYEPCLPEESNFDFQCLIMSKQLNAHKKVNK
jgi:RimJ/RimL family protein N-acetyltransferase